MIDYRIIEGKNGYFDCPKGMGVISTHYCSECHQKAKTKEYISKHKRTGCRHCPVGALHSGEISQLDGSRLFASHLCSRCGRQSNRLVHGRICVSCSNRAAEAIKNKNAKGNPLKLIRDYHTESLLIISDNNIKLVVFERVLNFKEAVLSVLLKEKKSVLFGECENDCFFVKN